VSSEPRNGSPTRGPDPLPRGSGAPAAPSPTATPSDQVELLERALLLAGATGVLAWNPRTRWVSTRELAITTLERLGIRRDWANRSNDYLAGTVDAELDRVSAFWGRC
jgi:hypothetical protein